MLADGTVCTCIRKAFGCIGRRWKMRSNGKYIESRMWIFEYEKEEDVYEAES